MLTERIIRDTKPHANDYIRWDDQVKGLGVRVRLSGTKTYILNYRVAGRERRMTMARTSEISLRAARARAGAALVGIRAGEGDPLTQRRAAATQPTVAEGLDRFSRTTCRCAARRNA